MYSRVLLRFAVGSETCRLAVRGVSRSFFLFAESRAINGDCASSAPGSFLSSPTKACVQSGSVGDSWPLLGVQLASCRSTPGEGEACQKTFDVEGCDEDCCDEDGPADVLRLSESKSSDMVASFGRRSRQMSSGEVYDG